MTLWRPCTVAATAKVHIWCVTGGCCRGMHNRPDQQLLKAKCCHACTFHGHTNRSLLHEQITVASEHCASIHSPRSIHRRQIALHFYYITRARFRAKYKRKNDLLACRHNADKSPHELDAQTEALTENAWHFFCDDATNWIQIEFEIKKNYRDFDTHEDEVAYSCLMRFSPHITVAVMPRIQFVCACKRTWKRIARFSFGKYGILCAGDNDNDEEEDAENCQALEKRSLALFCDAPATT